jgi:regulator of RNase E activity RraA
MTGADLDKIRALDTCTVSNAIERLNVRLRNEGFVVGTTHCRFPNLEPMLGYAVTGRIRTSSPPMSARCYFDRIDFWEFLDAQPRPSVLVLQDVDHTQGFGAFIGEIHAVISRALGCVGVVTNGAVRDLPAIRALEFHAFSGALGVSHAYAHLIDFGEPVEIGGLRIATGDLIHGDRHGVQTIPLEIVSQVPDVVAQIREEERELVDFCRSRQFSLNGLRERLQRRSKDCL